MTGNLRLPNPMFPSSCYDNGFNWYSFKCCEGDAPASHKSPGVPNTDFVLYVTARPTGGSTLAWALTCQSDQFSRPIAGHTNFSPARVSTDPANKAEALSTAIHEIAHSLGFSASHFPLFRKPGTLDKVDRRSDIVASFNEYGKTTSKIVGPRTVAAVKDHFGCSNWPNAGAELEDGGSSGTAGSHLEKRLFANEFMTGVADPNSVYSAVTLAIFEDSGWYAVSYDRAEKLPWGFKQGCDFVRKTCGEGWGNAYFCGRDQSQGGWEQGCTVDRRYRARCSLTTNPFELLPAFQYFSDPKVGGSDSFYDYCPIFRRSGTGDCRSTNTIPFWYYGESLGSTSMCFTGDFQRTSLNRALRKHSACVEAGCSIRTNLLELKLRQGSASLTVTCSASGGPVDLAALPGSQFTGSLDCPPSSSVCTGDPCDVQTCNGHGRCSSEDGTCACDRGYAGESAYSCDLIECPGILVDNSTGTKRYCSGHGSCNFELGRCESPTGQPGCDDGWRQSAGAFANECGERGCPLAAGQDCNFLSEGFDSQGRCECAGRGNCTQITSGGGAASVCRCPVGWVGSACERRDCPGSPQCGGSSRGACDSTRGVCECGEGVTASASDPRPVHFAGADCGTLVVAQRPFLALGLYGEARSNVTEAASLRLDGGRTVNVVAANSSALPAAASGTVGALEVTAVEPSAAGASAYGAAAVTVPQGEYRYLKFYAPSADVAVTFLFDLDAVTGADAGGVVQTVASAGAGLVVTASYSDASSPPSAASARFNATLSPTGNGGLPSMVLTLQPSGASGVGGFSQPGWIRVALLSSRAPVRGRVRVSRDACANIVCVDSNVDKRVSGGACRDGRCPCMRSATGAYGWTGADCSAPDCPGSPDCGGKRGTCTTPAQLTAAALTAGTAAPSGTAASLPSCVCSDASLYSGDDCNTLSLPSGTRTPGIDVNGRYFSAHFGQFDDYVANGTERRAVLEAGGSLDVGNVAVPFMLDPQALRTCCGFEPGASTVHVTLDAVSMPGRSAFNMTDGPTSSYRPQSFATPTEGIPDPVLLTRAGAIPSLSNYDNFDSGAWASLRPVHETIDRLPASDLFFIAVLNGRYATAQLRYTIRVEIVTGGSCPSGLNRCSGHSVSNSRPCAGVSGSGQAICECADGWEGTRCDIAAPPILSGDVVTADDIVPGSWRFFVLRVPEAAVEVRLTSAARPGHSRLAAPAVVAAWESVRDSTRSLAALQGATAMVDYDSFSARNATQSLVVGRSNPSSQRYLYVGVHNAPRGSGTASLALAVDVRRSPSLAQECPGGGCPELCAGRGRVASVNGRPQCFCDFGWRDDTRCESPQFNSFARLAEAAQQMGFLCSLCDDTVDLPRDGMAFFKAQRPLQRGTALQLSVGPPAEPRAAAAASASSSVAAPGAGSVLPMLVHRPQSGFSDELGSALLGLDADGLDVVDVRPFDAGSHTEAVAHGRRAQVGVPTQPGAGGGAAAGNTSLLGNPSLLVADALPRSILDFVVIRSSSRLNETVVVTDGTTAAASVWVTLYAQTEGRFALAATRAQLTSTPSTTSDFFQDLMRWLLTELTGQIVFFSLVGLLSCLCTCCLVFSCCPGARQRAKHQAEIESEKAKRELAAVFKSHRMMMSQLPAHEDDELPEGASTFAKIRAASRRGIFGPGVGASSGAGGGPPPGVVIASRRRLTPKPPGGGGSDEDEDVVKMGAVNPLVLASRLKANARGAKSRTASRRRLGGAHGADVPRSRRNLGGAHSASSGALSKDEQALAAHLRQSNVGGHKKLSAAKSIRMMRGDRHSRGPALTVEELISLPQVVVPIIPPPPPRSRA